ncbi:conjugative relaxase-like TrwC/TraI family protein [Kribbella antiqua]|uniref:Conjugative relaxase-like TrwC/TraI family protein n=1 Tax=Kribbella antiqua TaxID=2512217 RepID=A0A4R2I1F8_9ACTN|nr:MobF family relaxase [Kribbella antiqua]TCO37617.1 conjugative relaxase-like TrwC/TraI family protein [Kribbella antiqua]
MLSIHRLTAGDGYKYLVRHVASGDVDRRMATALTSYYAASGYPAGRWIGSGLSGLGDGYLVPGSEVTEPQMAALFGRAEDPLTGRTLGRPHLVYESPSRRIRAQIKALDPALTDAARQDAIDKIRKAEMRQKTQQAVAGFDLTFSPVKSVSALWATTDVGVQEQIVAAHHDAVNDILDLIEQHAALTRTGHGGIAQINTRGLIAAAFDHWDTRSGDPQLHTHVVVANRVQGPDGRWRTLDGRVLFRSAVAMSEIHNVFLADNLTRRLGVNWELRERGSQRNPAFEIDAVADELIREFSARTEQIDSNLAALLDEHDRPPSRAEMYTLRQQATLMNRPPKHLARPLAALMSEWRARANQAIGRDAVETIQRSLEQTGDRPLAAADLSTHTIEAYGATVVLTLQNKRATWTRWNLLAEAARQTRLLRLVSARDRFVVLQAVVESAEQQSISLTAPELVTVPTTRLEGESVFTIHNGQIFTSPVVLGAESVLLDLARDCEGPTIPASSVRTEELSADKVEALHRIAASGQKLEALIGPAGTGKTSLLSALTTSWESVHDEGSIIALAPSSAAATVLSDAIGSPTENIAKWIHESVGLGAEQRRQQIQQTEYAAQLASQAGRRRRHQRLSVLLATLRSEQDRWSFRANQLVIVDEASMAGTMELATLAREANAAGAKLLLVGDDAQLGAADTGGAFRLIARDTQAAELSDVWRFTNPWERDASLALRRGDLAVIDQYDDHDRLTAGASDDMETAAYQAWRADIAAGKTSLLIAADNTTVARLNARARLDRIHTGEVEPDGIELHNGNHVGIGDHVVTRLNNRRLRYGHQGFVQNGDQWTVIHRWPDGSLTVQNPNGETVTLPTGYVQESVELAYATTAHRAQGATVDTAHLLVSDQLTRALIYVGMTRGRHTNRAYVATHQTTSDMHEPHPEQTMQDVLEAVLQDPGTEQSAHEVMRQELDNATRLDRLVPIHAYLCQLDAHNRYREAIATSGLDPTDQAAVEASPAYGPLIATLRRAESAGLNIPQTLHRAVTQSPLHTAHDVAAVLHARLNRLITRAEHRTPQPPPLIAGLVTPVTHITDPTLIAPLRELEAQITQRANWLAEKAITSSYAWSEALLRSLAANSDSQRVDLLRRVAAYRERYGVNSSDPLGPAPAPTASHQRHHHTLLTEQLQSLQPDHQSAAAGSRDDPVHTPSGPALDGS